MPRSPYYRHSRHESTCTQMDLFNLPTPILNAGSIVFFLSPLQRFIQTLALIRGHTYVLIPMGWILQFYIHNS